MPTKRKPKSVKKPAAPVQPEAAAAAAAAPGESSTPAETASQTHPSAAVKPADSPFAPSSGVHAERLADICRFADEHSHLYIAYLEAYWGGQGLFDGPLRFCGGEDAWNAAWAKMRSEAEAYGPFILKDAATEMNRSLSDDIGVVAQAACRGSDGSDAAARLAWAKEIGNQLWERYRARLDDPSSALVCTKASRRNICTGSVWTLERD